MNLSDATTSYLNVDTGQPLFLNQDDELLEPDPLDADLCSDVNLPMTGAKEWNYILQMPGYYTNYNQQAFNNDFRASKLFCHNAGEYSRFYRDIKQD